MVAHDYWDCCMFLAILKGDDHEKLALAKAGIREAEAGKLVIVTSALTLAETLFLIRGELPVTHETRDKIRSFFQNDYILLRELDRGIAERAQNVVWDHDVHHKDAVHVATALSVGERLAIGRLVTFDGPLTELSGQIEGLQIGRPSYQVDLISDAAVHGSQPSAATGDSAASFGEGESP